VRCGVGWGVGWGVGCVGFEGGRAHDRVAIVDENPSIHSSIRPSSQPAIHPSSDSPWGSPSRQQSRAALVCPVAGTAVRACLWWGVGLAQLLLLLLLLLTGARAAALLLLNSLPQPPTKLQLRTTTTSKHEVTPPTCIPRAYLCLHTDPRICARREVQHAVDALWVWR